MITTVQAILLALQGAALVWLCFDRDKIVDRINALEHGTHVEFTVGPEIDVTINGQDIRSYAVPPHEAAQTEETT